MYKFGCAMNARKHNTLAETVDDKQKIFQKYIFSTLKLLPQIWKGNPSSLIDFYNWYHYYRAPYLQDNFLHVTLNSQDIVIQSYFYFYCQNMNISANSNNFGNSLFCFVFCFGKWN